MELNELSRFPSTHVEERISPHESEIIKYRDNRTNLVFTLTNGEKITGAIRWYDNVSIRVVQDDRSELTLMCSAIGYYRTSQ